MPSFGDWSSAQPANNYQVGPIPFFASGNLPNTNHDTKRASNNPMAFMLQNHNSYSSQKQTNLWTPSNPFQKANLIMHQANNFMAYTNNAATNINPETRGSQPNTSTANNSSANMGTGNMPVQGALNTGMVSTPNLPPNLSNINGAGGELLSALNNKCMRNVLSDQQTKKLDGLMQFQNLVHNSCRNNSIQLKNDTDRLTNMHQYGNFSAQDIPAQQAQMPLNCNSDYNPATTNKMHSIAKQIKLPKEFKINPIQRKKGL